MSPETEPLELIGIHHAFAETPFGVTLADRVRYEKYKPAEVDNEQWVRLLGADVNNLTHLTLTYGLTCSFVRHMDALHPGELSETDGITLKVAALIHDWAEAVVGDVSYNDKTEADEAEERQQFLENLSAFYAGDQQDIQELIALAHEEVVFSPETRLGLLFNAIERVGYMRTALRAYGHLKQGSAPECEQGLTWLVTDVFSNHLARLTVLAEELAPIRQYLYAQREQITEVCEMIKPEVFTNYGAQAEIRKQMVADGKTVWRWWLSTQAEL